MKKLLIIFILIFVTGCDSYVELNDLAIINSLGIEYKDNSYKIYAGIVNIKEKDALEPNIEIYDAEGKSLYEIIDNLSLTLNKKIYLSHLDLLLINDTLKNNQIKEMLASSIEKDKLSHSYLFLGTQGIGKKLLAREFAKQILYGEKKQNEDEEFNHPDFMQMEPDGNSIKIEQIRLLQKKYKKSQ